MHKKGSNMKIAVIGAGNAGQALAAYFKSRGHYVALYNRSPEVVEALKKLGTIRLTGMYEEEASIDLISSDIGEVIRGCSYILVTTPADSHFALGEKMGPYLEDGQKILLNPGRTAGTYAFLQAARQNGCSCSITVAETDTLIFTCRKIREGVCRIFTHKKEVHVAAHRAADTKEVLEGLQGELPGLYPASSVFHTGFSNIGMIFHPAPFLFNIARIEGQERFLHYQEGISPRVASFLEKMDEERIGIAEALGIKVQSAKAWLNSVYRSQGENLYEAIQDTDAYNEVYAPTKLESRYVYEDVTTGLVPFSELGRLIGYAAPAIDLIIDLAGQLYEKDFRALGRNAEKVNLQQFVTDCRAFSASTKERG